MITVIIAGGSGTRLWPLSTNGFPKHLLKLTNERSLLQNTFDRISQITSLDKIYIVPEVSHVEHVYEQLKEVDKKNILIEPGRRGTASCVIYALAELKKNKVSEQEPVFFLWADHLVRDEEAFTATTLRAGEIAVAEKKLVFIGVGPTYPATGFGYLERDGEIAGWQDAYQLSCFKEKPDYETAERYLQLGNYLWNTGYLVGTIEVFEREMQTNAPRLWEDYQKLFSTDNLNKTYLEFISEPIDTALSEKVKDGIVVPGSFDWVDVGSFHDLHEVSAKDEAGNHIRGEGVVLESATNSFVRNETDLPVAVIGLDNVVVVNSPNGVLVVNKNFAQKVGDVAKKIQNN
jgi:mannose-1-phosphate guanylyltransferase